MRVDLFDFDLPDGALRCGPPSRATRAPARRRSGASVFRHRVRDLPDLLRAGDALVFNDTKVIPAQLEGVRHRDGAGGRRFRRRSTCASAPDRWKAFAGPESASRGDRIRFGA